MSMRAESACRRLHSSSAFFLDERRKLSATLPGGIRSFPQATALYHCFRALRDAASSRLILCTGRKASPLSLLVPRHRGGHWHIAPGSGLATVKGKGATALRHQALNLYWSLSDGPASQNIRISINMEICWWHEGERDATCCRNQLRAKACDSQKSQGLALGRVFSTQSCTRSRSSKRGHRKVWEAQQRGEFLWFPVKPTIKEVPSKKAPNVKIDK